ncbi:hypothetical protein CNR22_10925 [Sphingobacteriaceae bacterium]|nr:hypothetical protein CNR22_10925 [Sphingobacteriaceae bacterium]
MFRFSEELLQFIWRHKLLKPVPLITKAGNTLTLLNPGELNVDAGPDFFNAKIKINELMLVGNVEIHILTSDWLKHRHQQDKSYNTIILHAVYEHDIDLDQNTKHNVEILELKPFIEETTLMMYEQLATAKAKLPCSKQLPLVSDLKFIGWIERMTIERLEDKVQKIEDLFTAFEGDYTQTFYTCLLRSFGFKVNALPFEMLAKHLPIHLVLKHSDNLMQLEALFLGMAGLLEDQFKDKYIQNLQNEFEYLKTKYQLQPLAKELFKFSKMRPANFPNVRLVQFAAVIRGNKGLFTNPQSKREYKTLMQAFEFEVSDYWKKHYSADGKVLTKELSFGRNSAESVIINAFAPFFFFYSKKLAKPEFTEATINLLNSCKVEVNTKTKLFESRKLHLQNAAASQGIINLHDNYCTSRRCLKCGIAAAILNPAPKI